MVHCGRCLPEGVMALAVKMMSGIPYSCYVHGEDVTTAADGLEYSWLVQRSVKNVSFVIANSQNTSRICSAWSGPSQSFFRRFGRSSPPVVLANGARTPTRRGSRSTRRTAKRCWPIFFNAVEIAPALATLDR